MSGGASAKTMYDRIVEMFKHFPTIDIDWKLIPIPPAVVVNEAVQTAAKIEDQVAERQRLENEKLKVEIEEEKRALPSAPMKEDEDVNPSAPSKEDSEDETDAPSEEELSEDKYVKPSAPHKDETDDDESKTKGKEKIGGEVETGDILFTKKECSFF